MEAGKELGIRNVGYYAMKCMRVERGRPGYGSELTPFTSPADVGLETNTNMDKVG